LRPRPRRGRRAARWPARGSLKAQLRHADALGARYVAILGEQELARGEVTLRDMRDSQQRTVAGETIEEELARE
jgi:histidyl-tRNA synthetase